MAWRGECVEESAMGALVTSHGIISVHLHNGVRVDLTVDKAIRLLNYQVGYMSEISGNGVLILLYN